MTLTERRKSSSFIRMAFIYTTSRLSGTLRWRKQIQQQQSPRLTVTNKLDLNLLAFKQRQPLEHICPCLGSIHQILDSLEDVTLRRTNLLGRVSLSERNGLVFDGLEINRNAKWRAELIVTSISLLVSR
jgi:hypothetical protein